MKKHTTKKCQNKKTTATKNIQKINIQYKYIQNNTVPKTVPQSLVVKESTTKMHKRKAS